MVMVGKSQKKAAASLKPWGVAFETLRERMGLSKGEVCRRAGLERPEYRSLCYSYVKGPGLETLGRLLKALECNWTEFGEVYEAASASAPSHDLLKKAVGHNHVAPPPPKARKAHP